jgi:transcriptional regulator with GAF, ATPase, and Fis domain
MQAVFHSLALNVHQLLKTNTFFVLLMNSTTQKLDMVFGMENGAPLAPFSLALDDPLAMSSRCARTRLEVVRHMRPGEPRYLAGNCPNLSNLYSPLIVGERLLGVMSVQTMESNAYGEREQSIFRTLCSYLTIALDNAAALQAQHEAEAQRAATLEQANATLEQLGPSAARSRAIWNRRPCCPRWTAMCAPCSTPIAIASTACVRAAAN